MLHTLEPDHGPAPPPPASFAGQGVTFTARCTHCTKTWGHTRSWAKAAWNLCAGRRPKERQLVRGTHDLVRVPGGWSCARCHLSVASHQRARQATHRCPVPCLRRPDGTIEHQAAPHLRQLVQAASTWGAQCYPTPPGRGTKRQQADAPPAPEGPPAVAGPPARRQALALRWVAHLGVTGPRATCAACLRCGLTAPGRDPQRLQGTSCPGEVPILPARVQRLLLAGAYDATLAHASAEATTRAAHFGWCPLHPPLIRAGRGGRGVGD